MAPLFHLAVGATLLGWPIALARARTWTGNGGGLTAKLWSDPDNWTPTGVPQDGEDLIFAETAVIFSPTPMVNDLTNLTVHSLRFSFNADFFTLDWRLSGNELGLTDSIRLLGTTKERVFISCPLRLERDIRLEVTDFDDSCELHLSGPMDLNGNALVVVVDTDNRVDLSGPIAGVGDLHIYPTEFAGNGPVTLSGSEGNTFQGRIILHTERTGAGPYHGARLALNKSAGVAVPGPLILGRESEVRLERSNQIGDDASVTVGGGAELLLQGRNDMIGGLVLTNAATDDAAAVVRTGGGTLGVQGDIVTCSGNPLVTHVIEGRLELPAGDHQIRVNGGTADVDIQAELTGFGNCIKTGDGTLILSASNSCNSSILINEGILDVRHNWGLGNTAGSTAISNGVLTLRDVAIGDELLFALGGSTGGDLPGSVLNVVGVASWAGQVVLYTNLNVIGGDMTFTGPISGEGSLGCFSGGTIQLGGSLPNTYTGLTLSRSPLLVLAKLGGARAFSGPLEVGTLSGPQHEVRWLGPAQAPNASVTLHETARINLNGFDDTFGPITFNGGEIVTGTGLLQIGGLVTVNQSPSQVCVMDGRIHLPPGYREFRVNDGDTVNSGLQVLAAVSGPGHLQKTGFGTMRLLSSNSYSGLTLVDQGRLAIAHGRALGGTEAGTLVADGARLQVWVGYGDTVPETISIRGDAANFFGRPGALEVEGTVKFRTPFPSIYACLDLPTNALVRILTNSTLTLDGFVSGPGSLTKAGPGTLVLSNSNPNLYAGDTLIAEGTLELRKPNGTLAVPGRLEVGPAEANSPATVRWFQTGGLNVNSTVTVNVNSLLDLNGFNQTLRQLDLNDGAAVQTGTGTLSFAPGASLNIGTLNPPAIGLRASASVTGKIALPALDNLTLNVAPYSLAYPFATDPELVLPAAISGAGNLVKRGAGSVRLSGANTFNDSPPYAAGDLYIYDGSVVAASPTALGGTAGWTFVYNGASLALINGITILGETLSLNSTNPAALDNRAGNNYWLGPVELARTSGIRVSQDWSLAVEGVIRGTGGLMKNGGGIFTLGGAGNNTHTGNTFVNEGTLLMAKATGFQAVPADLIVGQTNGGTAVARYLNHDQVWANIVVNRGGLLDLSGWDEYTGTLTLNGGGDVQTGTGRLFITDLTVSPGASGNPSFISGGLGLYPGAHQFTVNASAIPLGEPECNLTANILEYSTAASLTKGGAGVLRLSGTNTYLGSTTISGGTLWVDGAQPQSAVQVGTGTVLMGSGTVGHITVNGSGTVSPGASPGMLTCSNFTSALPDGGTLIMELGNPNPAGGDFDQLNVRGTVNLTGLTLQPSLHFASAPSDQYIIVANDGADAVTGTFTGLPQGKKLYIGRELFQISYTGGTGNDVVLTRLVTPPPPRLAIERPSTNAVRLRWPTNDPPFRLQTASSLPATNWMAGLPLPTLVGTNHVVTNATTEAQRLYRLIHP